MREARAEPEDAAALGASPRSRSRLPRRSRTPATAATSGSAASHLFVISPSLVSLRNGDSSTVSDRAVRVERTTDPERNAMPGACRVRAAACRERARRAAAGGGRARPRSTSSRASRRLHAGDRRSRSGPCRPRRRPARSSSFPAWRELGQHARRRSTAARACPRRRGSCRRLELPRRARVVCSSSQRQPPTSGAVARAAAIARTYGSSGSRGTSPVTSPRSTSSRRSRVKSVVSLLPTPIRP